MYHYTTKMCKCNWSNNVTQLQQNLLDVTFTCLVAENDNLFAVC